MTDRVAGEVKAGRFSRELLIRVASAIVLAAVALTGAVAGGWAVTAVIVAVASVVHGEWSALTERVLWPSIVLTAAIVVVLVLYSFGHTDLSLAVAVAAVAVGAATGGVWRSAGVLYTLALALGLLAIRLSAPMGLVAALFVLAVVWATDTGAFFAGRGIGGPKLWPLLSPKKTWAGAIGGLVAGIVAGTAVLAFAGVPVTAVTVLVAGLLAVSSEAGDLLESFVKRTFGAKDSGWLVPGHGGLMDRVDGLTAAAGLAALIGWAHAGVSVGQGIVAW